MAYTKTNWQNGVTPINETNLNKIENELEALDTGKADASSLSTVATSGDYNDLTNKPIVNVSSVETDEAYSCDYINNNVGIIDEGSNTNGNYIKYADGTMICYKTVTVQTAVNQAWGSMYETPSPVALGNYAQAFIEVPNIQATINNKSGGYGGYIARIDTPTTTSFGSIVINRPVSTVQVGFNIDLMAIGKWK